MGAAEHPFKSSEPKDGAPRHFLWLTCLLLGLGIPLFAFTDSCLTLVGAGLLILGCPTALVTVALLIGLLFKRNAPATDDRGEKVH